MEDPDKQAAQAFVDERHCEGGCDPHAGVVQLVYVKKWGWFAYCEAAIREDQQRGLEVTTL